LKITAETAEIVALPSALSAVFPDDWFVTEKPERVLSEWPVSMMKAFVPKNVK
jgi:hypothetical protein